MDKCEEGVGRRGEGGGREGGGEGGEGEGEGAEGGWRRRKERSRGRERRGSGRRGAVCTGADSEMELAAKAELSHITVSSSTTAKANKCTTKDPSPPTRGKVDEKPCLTCSCHLVSDAYSDIPPTRQLVYAKKTH